MEAKLKHLEFIQAAINRMANNSFLLKGWSVTIVGGLLAFSFKEIEPLSVAIPLTVLVFFWLLDGYYLSQERRFVKLYDQVRVKDAAEIDFSMDRKPFRHGVSWIGCSFSTTIALFYGGLLVVYVVILFASGYVTKSLL